MNDIIVPVDLTEEEKTILAVLSARQFLIILPAGIFSLLQLLFFNLPFIHGAPDFVIRLLFFVSINLATILLAFVKLESRDQYLSEFVVSKIKFLRSQKVYTI